MIARRFRALGWVASIASAATGLYLISLQVAAERAKLEAVDRRIAAAQREMRQLQTEFGTRASLRQLQKWNDEELAMAPPRAGQYLHSEMQLASLDRFDVGSAGAPSAVQPAALLAATSAPLARIKAPIVLAKAEAPTAAVPRPARVVTAAVRRTEAEPAAPSRLRSVAYVVTTATARPQRVALVDSMTLGDLARTAARERGGR